MSFSFSHIFPHFTYTTKIVLCLSVNFQAYRSKHAIIVQKSCPAPLATFQQAKSTMGEELVKAMEEQGYSAPTPIQARPLRNQKMKQVEFWGQILACQEIRCIMNLFCQVGWNTRRLNWPMTHESHCLEAQAWPIAVRGHDLIAVAKTGSGKTNGSWAKTACGIFYLVIFDPKIPGA